MYDLHKNVPVPKPDKRSPPVRRKKYPFEVMEVGDMFFIPAKTKNNLMSLASSKGKTLGRKFATRLTYMAESLDGWKPAEKGSRGAVQGIAVWRIK